MPGLALPLFAQVAPSGRATPAPIPYADIFRATCGARYGDRVAQSYVESRWNPRAVSPVGAQGLLQAMPGTWTWYQDRGWVARGASPFDPAPAIVGGHRHMVYLEAFFQGDQVAAWAAFNWGQGNVRRVVRIIQAREHARALGLAAPSAWLALAPRETQDYVVRIPATRARLQREGRL